MKARIFWTLMVFLLGAAISWKVVQVRKSRSAPDERPAEVALIRTAQVVRADLDEKVAFTGTIRPRNEVDVFAKVPGRIESLSVQVGDQVKAGQVLAVVEHKEIAWQAKAAAAQALVAKAALDGARLEHDRTVTLFKGGSATEAMVDGVKIKVQLAEAQLAQAQAAEGLARQSLANATVVAPISGVITRRPVNLGTMAAQVSVIATIQDVSALKLEGSVDAAAFARLRKGADAQVTVDALHGEVFPGKVTVLSPSLDPIARRANLEIEVDNASGRLLPNMFARAEVVVGRLPNAVAVPKVAVYEGGGGAVVYRVRDGKVEAVRPALGVSDGELTAVLEGLAEGDVVAASGQASLADGAPVKVSGAVERPATARTKVD